MAPICPSSCSFIGFEIPFKDTSLQCKTEVRFNHNSQSWRHCWRRSKHDALCPRVYRFAAWLTVQAVPLISSIRLLFLAFPPKPHSENPSFQFCEQQTSKYALSFEVYLYRSLGLLCFTLGVGMAVVTCPISYTSQSKSKSVKQCPTIAQNFSMKTLLIGDRFKQIYLQAWSKVQLSLIDCKRCALQASFIVQQPPSFTINRMDPFLIWQCFYGQALWLARDYGALCLLPAIHR
jgi:hypothetical protein